MPAQDNVTKVANISATVRELDFITRFGKNWEALLKIIGVSRLVEKQFGTELCSLKGVITLQSGSVSEGDEIPNSQAGVVETKYAEMDVEKYEKAVTMEAIKKYGYSIAVEKTDEAFLNALQGSVMDKYYAYLATGELTNIQTNFQKALGFAKALIVNKWKKAKMSCTEIVGFVNVLDVYEYLGTSTITVQNEFGFDYIKNFMGYGTIFLCSDDQVARGKIYATPVENIGLYFVNPANSDFAKAGLQFTVDGVTPLIGFHTEANYKRMQSESFAILGVKLFSEYIDGIASITVEASGSLGSLTVSSAEGTASGSTKITVTETRITGGKLFYKASTTTTAPTTTYLAELDNTWTSWDGTSDIALAYASYDGKKITIAEVNGSGQVIKSGSATLDIKS